MNPSRLLQTFPGRLFTKMNEDNAFNWAVIIAWNFLQSLFPIVLVMAAILGVVLGSIGVGSGRIYATILSIIPDATARHEALGALDLFHRRSGLFFVVGFAGLLWSGAGLFRAMEQAFAVIYHTRQRSLVRGIAISFGMVLILTVLGGLMIVSSTLLSLLNHLPGLPDLLHNGVAALVLQAVIGVLAGLLLFLCIYYVMPNCRLTWGEVWPGALVAGVLFEALTLFFPLYLRVTGSGTAYGKSFGLLFLLMVFFYFLGIVTMVGVEINALLYPVPVDQPDGPASLITPVQSQPASLGAPASPASPARPAPPAPARRPSAGGPARRIKGILAFVILWFTGALRRRRPAS